MRAGPTFTIGAGRTHPLWLVSKNKSLFFSVVSQLENELVELAFPRRKGCHCCDVKEETIDTYSKALKINLDRVGTAPSRRSGPGRK